ncbi:gliding motility-associated C-terminal domain-containing protein, partial [Flavobacterium sp. XS1P27]|uniref:T9SS type B sorting domain-containing protein n=1 Tax=Flavobacterium sp. XS1P27 TaxID=3401724 RepID=UPI003AB0C948
CEVDANPINCKQATVTIVVANELLAVADDYSTTPLTSNDTTPSVVLNDSLDGVTPVVIGTNPGEVTLTGVTVPTQLTLDTATGIITVNANTPSGTYTVVYEICEVDANPINCKQATVTIVVANELLAVADDYSTTPLTSNDATPSVVLNDSLDGVTPVVIGTNPGEVTLTGVTVPTQLTLDTATGIITVNANTPSGTYTVVYEICEVGASPINCKQATATVVVSNPLVAVNDTPAAVAVGDSTSSVVVNDTLDGSPVVIGTNPGEVSLAGVTVPAGLTLNGDGTITVNANTPSGTYTVVYEICEVGASPINCKQVTATVVVSNPLVAVNDTPAAVAVGDSTPSVVVNDTLDGSPVVIGTNPGEVSLAGVTVPAGLTLNGDGTITVNANTPSGTYTVVYEICEVGASPVNCQTATVIIVVNNVLVANDDNIPSTGGNVTTNDTINGEPATAANTDVTPSSNGPLSIDADGNVTVAPNTPSGTYTLTYEICEAGATPTNCTTATVTVNFVNPLVASNDTFTGAGGNVLGNDSVNGAPATMTNIVVTPVSTGPLSIDAAGNLTVAPNTPSGTYTIVYEICQTGMTPANCTTATVTVVVSNPIVANNNTFSATGGNVIANDTVNGAPATPANTDVTPVSSGPLSIDANGNLTVAPNTPSGTYSIEYEICEVGAVPSNCTRAIATVVVNNTIVANNDSFPATGGNVIANDTVNGAPATPVNTDVTPVSSGPLSIDANGNLTVAANAVAGTYTITYQVCETGSNPLSCTTAQATVVINEAPQIAIVKTAVFNDENGDGFAQAGESITYSFAVTNIGNTPLSNVTVTDVLPGLILTGNSIPLLPVGETNNTAYQGVYRLTQADINLGSVTNQAKVTGVTPLGVIISDLSDDSSALNDRPTVLGIQGCVIEVFNAVAPNGSGDNKVFRIRGLECYSDNTVEIYNRWGVLVFERAGYNNDDRAFRGISEGRVTINQSEELPEGTYYYILRYKDSAATSFEKAGYLYINR